MDLHNLWILELYLRSDLIFLNLSFFNLMEFTLMKFSLTKHYELNEILDGFLKRLKFGE